MRVLVCNGFASELGPGQYAPTDLSNKMTERKTIGKMDSLLVSYLYNHSHSQSVLIQYGQLSFIDLLPIIRWCLLGVLTGVSRAPHPA